MAPTFLSGLAMLLSVLFPEVELDALNTTLNTLVVVGAGLVIMFRQWFTGRSTWFGGRPKSFQG